MEVHKAFLQANAFDEEPEPERHLEPSHRSLTPWGRQWPVDGGLETVDDEEVGGGAGFDREHHPTVAMSATKTHAAAMFQRVASPTLCMISIVIAELNRAEPEIQFSNHIENIGVQ